MGNKVLGKNIIGSMKVAGEYYPIFCGKTLSFTLEQDELEISTVSSGVMRQYMAGMGNATFEVGGVTILDNTQSRIAISYLQQKSIAQATHEWKIALTDESGNSIYYLFSGIIRTTSFDKSIPGYSQSSLSVRVTGEIDITYVDPPPPGGLPEIVRSDWWDMAAGATYIDGISTVHNYTLTAVTILQVDRSGIQYDLITSGAPTGRQCKHNNTTGVISFDPNLPSNGETVFVLFKYTP